MSWQAAHLRFTVFPVPSTTLRLEEWWEAALQSEPERVILDRRSNSAHLHGQFGAGHLSVVAASAPLPRVDWLWGPGDSSDPTDLSTLGAYQDAVLLFRSLLDRALTYTNAPVAERVALGLVLWQPVDSRSAGYAVLQRYLEPSVRLDVENTSDFLYQINRPRMTNINRTPLRINRLSKWSVLYQTATELSFAVVLPQLPLLSEPQLVSEHLSAQLELDINTAPSQVLRFVSGASSDVVSDSASLSYTSVTARFQEYAFQIAEEGDIS